MFTGIIEGMGSITAIRSVGQARRLAITADYGLEGTRVGDSIAVSGACLTAVMISGKRCTLGGLISLNAGQGLFKT